jgi:hypothetical protein
MPTKTPKPRRFAVRNTRAGSVIDLFDQGLSFQLMLSWGRLPPLRTMNAFLACGRDDTDAQDGLLQWEPISLSPAEYHRLARDLRQRGHSVSLETLSPGKPAPAYEDWFASHLAEASTGRRVATKSARSK